MSNPKQPFAITLNIGSSLANETGSWRSERPVYVDLLPPCNKACPSGENIQQWLFHAEEGDYESAWRQIMQDNPLPATMGRVCYHPCETACNRVQVDEAVGINAIERFLGDKALAEGWRVAQTAPESGKRVLIVGAGPSGLSAAYHLRLAGHTVHVKEAGPMWGGMMRFGIPSYRLPRNILDAEVQRIQDLGVTFEFNTKVENVETEVDSWDAIFLAVGAHIGRRAYIPAAATAKVMDAVSVLANVESGDQPLLGRRVVVYGGGNTAIDMARTAKRLGAEEAVIVYRRTRDRMPAHDSEVLEAEEEGIMMRWLSTVKHVDGESLTIEKMELDENGFPQPTGEFEELGADSLIMALGQEADLSLIENAQGIEIDDGVVKVNDQMMTSLQGVFAGGDMVPSERTVTVAIGHGKKASRYIDAYLRGTTYTPAPKPGDATFDRMTPWYYADAPQQVRKKLEGVRRASNFDEVVLGLDEASAVFEARRCMSCGNCFGCDNCFGVCPDNAITKIRPTEYEFKYDYCKGCGVCVEECPCGSISMVPEEV
ncbi:NAD-dependent dihydropyrimidine dehydrogenase sunbunit PreT [Actinomyces bovis]|uniref:NAD-dependent dihydropyrimidine dehydrogenase sunbunit PreT n=1 Tax=Actinomyces bovis TaxID=1658 RepID=A0ABY1VJU7_9ACTO|nr:NAD(P)-binding protein [Actinomyces bovis]SPT52376.1 NAD-dependent dihydropyrimidine dehydrogenase sunbunit PreT [Actinomyces bovis]VEG53962.1 NAD-dependent dihydropyrimidine dehydrogenase sunbunit PreT [Actinomyces israelii]